MKVLHINSYYNGSFFYRSLYDMQKESSLDFNVYVPVSKGFDTNIFDFGKYTDISENHGKYDRLIFYIKHMKIYNDIVLKYDINKFSIIHAHSLFSNGYIAMKLKREFEIPYIVAVRNTDVNVFFKYMIHMRKLGVEILKEAEKVIFLSEPYRELLIEKYVPAEFKKEIAEKSEVIPNGIDDFWFKNKGTIKAKPKKEELKLVYAGVINKNKNLLTTVKSIELLETKGFNVKFTVVGRVLDKVVYQKLMKEKCVDIIEPKTKEELIGIYRKNDIFVMPSITETFGLVYAEAMSQGLPVIYTKGQGFDRQFEEGQAGYHVECLDAQDIAEKIVRIVDNYQDFSENCIEKCSRFNWHKISMKYAEIYAEHCKETRRQLWTS